MLKTKTINPEKYRNIIGHFTSGISVITTKNKNKKYGLTASSLCSVSLDPPQLLVCVNKDSGTEKAIKASNIFNVNILNSKQGDIAKRFATAGINKFKNIDFSMGKQGIPYLNNSMAVLSCKLVKRIDGGTHSIFLAKIYDAWIGSNKNPLVYYRGNFGEFYKIN